MARSLIVLLVLLGLLLGGAALTYRWLWHEEEEPTPAPAPPPAALTTGVRLIDARGRVERQAEAGEWLPLGAGETVGVAERVRTDSNSRAELDIGDGSTLVLADRSELEVRKRDARETRFRLRRGRVFAKKQRQGKSLLRIEAPATDAAVTSEEGSFTVTTDGLGTLALATTAGNAKISAGERETAVEAGQQTVAFADGTVNAAAAIPESLLLKVGRLPKGVRRKRAIIIEGTSEPGAAVLVNGVAAQVDRRGRFRARVSLSEGSNELSVVAHGVAGQTREVKLAPITVDSRAPGSKVDARWE